MRLLLFLQLLFLLSDCSRSNGNSSDELPGMTYVEPSIDSRGRFRKGHLRQSVSLKKDAAKSQMRSHQYYHTKGKYKRKRRKH